MVEPAPDRMAIAPALIAGVDLARLALDARDGFILSRIDGETPASSLADLVGLSEAALAEVLERLERLGVVRWSGAGQSSGDLSGDERARILAAERAARRGNYWELLGVGGDVTAAEVKRAYFASSKLFHPDRYFGRDLGVFKEKLSLIFQAMKRAEEVLGDDAARRAYERQVPPPRPAVAVPAPPPSPTPADLEAHRQQIISERKQKRAAAVAMPRDPEKARELHDKGVSQLQAGDHVGATQSFKLALVHDPQNSDAARLYAAAQAQADLARARRLAEQGEKIAEQGRPAVAAQAFAQAFELSPSKASYAIRAAEELLRAGEATRALELADKAVQVAPQRAETRLAAARALEALKQRDLALTHLEALVGLERADPRVRELMTRLTKAKP